MLTEVNRMREIMGLSLLNETGVPGLAADFVRSFFGDSVTQAAGKLRNAIGSAGTAISDELANDIMDAFPKLMDDINTWDTLDDTLKKGFMRAFREIPEISAEIYKNILKQIDVTADEFAGSVIETMSSKGLSYEEAVADILLESDVSDDVVDIIQKNLRKTYDEVISTGSNIVSPLTKRITSVEDALNLIERDLGFPLSKLRKIRGMNEVLNRAADDMVGKTVGETKKKAEETLSKITANKDFVKAWESYTNTNWQNAQAWLKRRLDAWVVDYEQTGNKWYWQFGGEDFVDAAGNKKVSIPRSAWKATKNFIAIAYVMSVYDNFMNKGMTIWKATTAELHEAFIGIVGFLAEEIFGYVSQKRDEAGDLTIEQAKEAFESTAEKLGKSMDDYDFEKIKRGVWRVIDFTDDPQDYAIIRYSGETTIAPWSSDLEGYDWDSLGDGSRWEEIKASFK